MDNKYLSIPATDAATLLAGRSKHDTLLSEGLHWNILEAGQGDETLVFLPGTLGTVNIFSKQVLEFSSSYRVVVLGYPGESDIDLMTASFFGILRSLDIPSAHFIGSSLGAFWLQQFSHSRVDFVKSLFLGNTFVDSHRLRFIKMFQPAFLSTASAHDVKQSWLGFINGLPSEELKEFLLKDVGEEQDASELAGRSFTIAHLGRVSLSNVSPDRITLLTCDDDKVITNDTAQELAGAYSGARHIRLPHGGHYPHVLNPSAYRDAISARLHG